MEATSIFGKYHDIFNRGKLKEEHLIKLSRIYSLYSNNKKLRTKANFLRFHRLLNNITNDNIKSN